MELMKNDKNYAKQFRVPSIPLSRNEQLRNKLLIFCLLAI